MKGIIMAGGEGTRLRPLTCECPKPMIRLMDRPMLAYAIELLKAHGIVDIAVTLGYRAEAIRDAFGDGGDSGVRLRYYTERAPLGTAGGVCQAADFLDDTFIVLSGDGVTDLDITAAAAFHRSRRALATLVLKRTDDPLDYGVVDLDDEGRVRSFQEKPDWSEVLSDTVNTGIYILEPEVLEHIPKGRSCDFGHELFPGLVREGLPVFGYVTGDYWCDVGDVRAYLQVHADAMEGRIRLEGLRRMGNRAEVRPGAVVDRAAVLEGPCLIEAGARLRAGAYVGPCSVIGLNCEVGEGASVKRGILWPGARLDPHAQVRGGVLAANARLGKGAQIYEECVLGANAIVEDKGVLLSGVKLWPGKRVSEGERLDANRVWGGQRYDGSLAGTLPATSPAEAARAAQAVVAAMKPREMLLGHRNSPLAEALCYAAAAGCMAQGAAVVDAGPCTLPLLRHTQRFVRSDAAMFLDDDSAIPLNALGARLPHKEQRAVALLNARQDFPRPDSEAARSLVRASAAATAYVGDVAGIFTADPRRAAPVALYCGNGLTLNLAKQVLDRAGVNYRVVIRETDLLPISGEIGLILNESGEICAFSDGSGGLTEAQHQLLIAWTALEYGEEVLLLPDNATQGIDKLADRYGAKIERVAGEPALWMNALAGRSPFQFELHFDGLILALRALSLLTAECMSLSDWRRLMPEVFRRSRIVPIPARQNGRILHAFAQAAPDARLGGGARIDRERGWAWVGADEGRSNLRIVAEGASAEIAAELCDLCEDKLRAAMEANS